MGVPLPFSFAHAQPSCFPSNSTTGVITVALDPSFSLLEPALVSLQEVSAVGFLVQYGLEGVDMSQTSPLEIFQCNDLTIQCIR